MGTALSPEQIAQHAEELPIASSASDFEKPILAGRYRLDERVNEGGMGVIYAATQIPLNRQVAIKLIHPEVDGDPDEFARRFVLEAATLARISHPNIVTIHDYGQTEGGELFIAMEFLHGRSLADVLAREPPLPFRRQLRIAMQIARALREAHELGVVHRDLKPANVMLVKGADEDDRYHVKLLDFGLAKVHPKIAGLNTTRPKAVVGSPRYMAPEQICGEEIDIRADIYSLGAIMFTMAAGAPPFDGTSATEIVRGQLRDPAPPIGSVGLKRQCPPAYEELIQRCLAKLPQERFESIQALLEEIKDAFTTLPAGDGSTGDALIDSGVSLKFVDYSTPPQDVLPPIAPSDLEYAVSLAETTIRELSTRHFQPPMRTTGRTLFLGMLAALVFAVGAAIFFAGRASSDPDPTPVVAALPPPPPPPRAPAPPPPEVSLEAQVTFRSSPSGAVVFENDVSLGVTPFVRTLRKDESEAMRSFVFRLAGHEPITATTLVRDEVEVFVALSPVKNEKRVAPIRNRIRKRAPPPPSPEVAPPVEEPRPVIPTLPNKAADLPLLEDDDPLLE